MERLKKDILSEPTLARPETSTRFYTKTDCSKDGMEAVLPQADVSEEARNQRHKKRTAESVNLTNP